MNSLLANWSPRVLSVLRIITGFLFIWHGSQKLFNFPASAQGGGASGLMMFAEFLISRTDCISVNVKSSREFACTGKFFSDE